VTLCVAVTTADGLVMGADSMTVVRDGRFTKTYANANKVFEIPGLRLAVMTYGLGALGRRSIAGLVDEWIAKRPAFEKSNAYTVNDVGQQLGEFVFGHHRRHREFIEEQTRKSQATALKGEDAGPTLYNPLEWTTGLVIGGYQPGSPFPWLWRWEEPAHPGVYEGLEQIRPHEGSAGEYGPPSGLDYWGDTTALERLVEGRDKNLLSSLEDRKMLTRSEDFEDIIEEHRWDVLHEGMPLKDAADLAEFALKVGVGYEHFRKGTPGIGGELDIVVITPSGLHWHERKALTRALAPRIIAPAIGDVPKSDE